MQDVPGYARRVPKSEIVAEEYNCNIRRYVDNAPPPEPHDVRAHLQGGVPVSEVDALSHFWKNYSDLRSRCFVARKGDARYVDFASVINEQRVISELVKSDPSVSKAHKQFIERLNAWWIQNLPLVEALAPQKRKNGNVYELRRQLLADISQAFSKQTLLSDHQVRGAFARYVDDLKADLKSIAASGWGAELIPDDEILQSQFPELLTEMEQKRLRLAELSALLAAADEEDYEDVDETGILPDDEVKKLKAEIKEARAQARLAKKEKRTFDSFIKKAESADVKLARHKAFEDEARQLKSDLRITEKKKEELVAAARTKIDNDEARRVILKRLHRLLIQTYESYLLAGQRACLSAIENLYIKYAVTVKTIEECHNKEASKLKKFLAELGYE